MTKSKDEPVAQPELRAKRPPRPPKPGRHADPNGAAWHAEAAGRWGLAVSLSRGDNEEALGWYRSPDFPKWTGSSHVKRELLGRYIEDRSTGLVHDVEHATEFCGIDGIVNATFYHFELELPDHLTDHSCMGEEG